MPSFFKHALRTRVDDQLEQSRSAAAHERDVYRVVNVRDQWKCRACHRPSDPHAVGLLWHGHHHHVVYRSAGGPTELWNVCLLCASCHDAEHVKRTLHVDGQADDALTFWKKDTEGIWYVWRREIAVGRFERD